MATVEDEDREMLQTKSGVVLTGEDIEAVSQEAETEYDLIGARLAALPG